MQQQQKKNSTRRFKALPVPFTHLHPSDTLLEGGEEGGRPPAQRVVHHRLLAVEVAAAAASAASTASRFGPTRRFGGRAPSRGPGRGPPFFHGASFGPCRRVSLDLLVVVVIVIRVRVPEEGRRAQEAPPSQDHTHACPFILGRARSLYFF